MVWTLFHQSRSQGPVNRKNSAVFYFMHSQQNVKGITEITIEVVQIYSGITQMIECSTETIHVYTHF